MTRFNELKETEEYLLRCIQTCKTFLEISAVFEWVERKITQNNFPHADPVEIKLSFKRLFQHIEERKEEISGIREDFMKPKHIHF